MCPNTLPILEQLGSIKRLSLGVFYLFPTNNLYRYSADFKSLLSPNKQELNSNINQHNFTLNWTVYHEMLVIQLLSENISNNCSRFYVLNEPLTNI